MGRNGFARAYARDLRGYVVTPKEYDSLQFVAAFIGGPVWAVDGWNNHGHVDSRIRGQIEDDSEVPREGLDCGCLQWSRSGPTYKPYQGWEEGDVGLYRGQVASATMGMDREF